MRAERIIDPRTGEMTTVYALSREHGIASYIIWHRYDTLGIRSETLIAPPGTEIDIEAERRIARGIWLRSRIGILSTHRLGEFARALRQHSQAQANDVQHPAQKRRDTTRIEQYDAQFARRAS